MNSLRTNRGRNRDNWNSVINDISRVDYTGKYVTHRIISDLWWFKNGIAHYMSIKTVKPNIDQTAAAKQDLLRLALSDFSCEVYFGLAYNPYGEDSSSYAHNPPMGIFDFHNDEVVLIGRDYWDTLGGRGCYEDILEIAKNVGEETRLILEKLK
jgi:hypothetical protein